MTRTAEVSDFLKSTNMSITSRKTIAGDASNRRYERVFLASGETLVLMDAPPEKGEDTRPFLAVADYLRKAGLSAPNCFAKDIDKGFLLIEDFGDALYDQVVQESPDRELDLYLAAWDALHHLAQAGAVPAIPPYDPADMSEKAALAAEWYDTSLDRGDLVSAVRDALDQLDWADKTLALRDFHAQNLIWLPEKTGVARVGLLDFQDAQPGHFLYDLVSLAFDARRDVSPDVQAALLDRAKQDTQLADFDAAVAALLAQRSLRIIGVFARLWLRDGKAGYLQLLPRVFGHLDYALSHPSLTALKQVLQEIDRPTQDKTNALRTQR